MDALPKTIRTQLEAHFDAVTVKCTPAHGGDISSSLVVSLSNGEQVFLKYNSNGVTFEAEALGLQTLSKFPSVTVPRVSMVSSTSDGLTFMALECIGDSVPRTGAMEERFGEQLANMHRASMKQEYFGFEIDNYIGLLPQKNVQHSDSWSIFFVEQRLDYQIQLAITDGWWDDRYKQLYERKRNSILHILQSNSEPPCVLHGDLWAGNVLWSRTRGPILIDPAVYYGNREADLAFTEMFGGFGSAFYRSYNATFPLLPGYEERKPILNLYHLLTHSNMFGGSYRSQVKRVLSSIPDVASGS